MPAPARRPPAAPAPRPSGSSGQATLDYVTVLAVVGAVLVLGTGVALARGGEIAAAVRGEFVRALCIVAGHDCERDRTPCVVRVRSESRGGSLNIGLVRVGREHVALVEERSDGTFALTLLRTSEFGAEIGLGAGVELPLGGELLSAGAEMRAAVIAREGRGRTWFARSREEVDGLLLGMSGTLVPKALQERLSREPDVTITQHGWDVTLGGGAQAGPAGAASVTLTAGDLDGARTDRRTGRTVLYLKRSNDLGAALDAPGADEATIGGAAEHVWGIEVDPAGRPVDLVLVNAGAYGGTGDLPAQLGEIAGVLGVPADGARRYELESHLDLTVPENLAAASEFIAAVRAGGPRPGRERAPVAAALARRLREHAVLHARTYEVDADTSRAGAHVAVGLKVGGSVAREEGGSRLLAAMTRGPDGTWRRRDDCATPA